MLKFSELKENFVYPDVKVIQYKGKDIFVKQFLPTEDKYGLIITATMSLGLNIQPYNPLTGEILFDTEVIKYYSSINFDEEESFFKIYDILQVEGLMDLIIEQIPVEEYEELQRLHKEFIEYTIAFNGNLANGLQNLLDNLPSVMHEFDNIDAEALKQGEEMVKKLTEEKHI
jgi:hypothetical protein